MACRAVSGKEKASGDSGTCLDDHEAGTGVIRSAEVNVGLVAADIKSLNGGLRKADEGGRDSQSR